MILSEVARSVLPDERIIKIASSFSFVSAGTTVHELLAEMKDSSRHAVAVIDKGRLAGIIVAEDLMEILGKPFGRDLLRRQRVEDVMRSAVTFRYDEYIQSIMERVQGDLEAERDAHYVLVDESLSFRGHVSARDIISYALEDKRREVELAARIQSRLVPPFLERGGQPVSFVCSSVMAQGVGGDYYTVIEYEPGRWFFCLCDISGKGVSAAIITAMLGCFMQTANLSGPLEAVLQNLNRIIHDTFHLEKYLTGLFARFCPATGELEYCDMGHSLFFVVTSSGCEQLHENADNMPLGLEPVLDPVVRTLRLAGDTTLLLLSDGVIEQKNRSGEQWPLSAIGTAIEESLRVSGDPVRAKIRILESFFSFKEDVPQHDDISMLIFHYR